MTGPALLDFSDADLDSAVRLLAKLRQRRVTPQPASLNPPPIWDGPDQPPAVDDGGPGGRALAKMSFAVPDAPDNRPLTTRIFQGVKTALPDIMRGLSTADPEAGGLQGFVGSAAESYNTIADDRARRAALQLKQQEAARAEGREERRTQAEERRGRVEERRADAADRMAENAEDRNDASFLTGIAGLIRAQHAATQPPKPQRDTYQEALDRYEAEATARSRWPILNQGKVKAGGDAPGGSGTDPGKTLPATMVDSMLQNDRNANTVDEAIAALDANPGAVGTWKNWLLPRVATDMLDPAGAEARNPLSDIGSLVIKDRSGAAVSVHELKRLGFIPSENDRADVAKGKLQRLADYIRGENRAAKDYYKKQGYGVPDEAPHRPPKALQRQPGTSAPAARAGDTGHGGSANTKVADTVLDQIWADHPDWTPEQVTAEYKRQTQ